MGRFLTFASAGAIIAAVIAAIWVIGGPGEARMARENYARMQSILWLAEEVDFYRDAHDKMPETLEAALTDDSESLRYKFLNRSRDPLIDPVTGEAYRYEVRGEDSFIICAPFHGDPRRAYMRDHPFDAETGCLTFGPRKP